MVCRMIRSSECFANDQQGPNLPGDWIFDCIGCHCEFLFWENDGAYD